MKRFYQALAALLMMMAVQEGVFAQTNTLNVTTTAVPFLRISPDARAGGMATSEWLPLRMRLPTSTTRVRYPLPLKTSALD